jgi:RNA polymerase sigma-70 factor (ECF subfamily)
MPHDDVVRALHAAVARRDLDGLRALLGSGMVLTVDAGGRVPAPSSRLHGGNEIAAYLGSVFFDDTVRLDIETVNGSSGLVMRSRWEVLGVLVLEVRRGLVDEGWFVTNPDKLRGWNSA